MEPTTTLHGEETELVLEKQFFILVKLGTELRVIQIGRMSLIVEHTLLVVKMESLYILIHGLNVHQQFSVQILATVMESQEPKQHQNQSLTMIQFTNMNVMILESGSRYQDQLTLP